MTVRPMALGIAVVLVVGLAAIGYVFYQNSQGARDSQARATLEAVLRTSGYSVSVVRVGGPSEEDQGIGAYVTLETDGDRDEAAGVCALVATTMFGDWPPEHVRVFYGPTHRAEEVTCN